jgi:hypothetical protein
MKRRFAKFLHDLAKKLGYETVILNNYFSFPNYRASSELVKGEWQLVSFSFFVKYGGEGTELEVKNVEVETIDKSTSLITINKKHHPD